MRAFTIPSVFTAIDKFTQPIAAMGRAVGSFALKAEAGISRADRVVRKLTPVLGATAKQFLSFASAATVAGAIVGGVNFSIKSLKDYETAIASFRTIVSDASDKEFAAYKEAINQVAADTKKSSIDVAASFEKIAGLNAEFAETAEGLGAVSKASITLSKASGADLGESAENLVGIMNQFSLGANEADRAINVLAAGQAVGAANIRQTSESFVNFGSVAAGANISLEQAVGLVQTLGKFSLFGAEAGTKLRGSILKLQQAGVGYKSGQFQINDALAEARSKIDRLKTAKAKDAALTKMFGAENIATGRILLANIDLYKKFTEGVTGTNQAQTQADINSQSLTVAIDELKASWINMLTSSDKATSGLRLAKQVIQFLTRNLESVVSIGTKVVLFFAGWKALVIASKAAMIGYNVVLGITSALSGTASVAVGKSNVALKAYALTSKLATANQWLLNTAMSANPVGAIIIAIVALIAVVVAVVEKWNDWGAALSLVLGPLGWIISIIQSLRRNWDMIVKAFEENGILGAIDAIGRAIFDAILQPLQQAFQWVSKLTGWDWAASAAEGIGNFRENLGVNVTTDESGNPLPSKQAINPEAVKQGVMKQTFETVQKQNVAIDINDKTGRAKMKTNKKAVPVKLTSTSDWEQ